MKLFTIHNLNGGYGKEAVIRDFSIQINQGDFIGIIGPNGSGKTTLLRLLTRVLRPHSGKLFFEDKDLTHLSLKEFCRKVAFVSQDIPIHFPISVFEMVLMGRTPHLKRLQKHSHKDYRIAEESLSKTDALHLRNNKIDELSAGERQRVMIAKALAQTPVLLFLDEPTSHLDIGHQIQIMNLIQKLNRHNGVTVVLVLHDLNLAGEYCSRLILMNEGNIFREGTVEEVLTYQNIEEVYKTIVVVKENPISQKPYVILVSGEK
ncbi:MAG: ABC transporter ATP-binding protein [Candidatus Aureabacteria bacterium]|nr:ABC transporter ATP-binding protein [Candidatus Auribacterota bacterium]